MTRASSSWWVIQIAAFKYPQERKKKRWTRFRGTCKQSIVTLYYLTVYSVYDAILQVHGITHNLLFFSLLQFHSKTHWIFAEFTRQIDVPERLAQMTCWNDLPKQLAELKCNSSLWIFLAGIRCDFSSRDWLARVPPPPLRIPKQDPACHYPPPPHRLHITEEGEGAGSWPGSPMHPEQVL